MSLNRSDYEAGYRDGVGWTRLPKTSGAITRAELEALASPGETDAYKDGFVAGVFSVIGYGDEQEVES